MPLTDLGLTDPAALPLGLGCNRLGSVTGSSPSASRRLLSVALEEGFRFFDTANIYGQGASERILGAALGSRSDCIVLSKAGRYVRLRHRLILPAKGLLAAAARASRSAHQQATAARSRPIPEDWSVKSLERSLDGTLRRLRRERVDMFMLHSPPAEAIRRGDAVGALEKARLLGKIGIVGVSVDDVEGARLAIEDDRVRAIQLPVRPAEHGFHDALLMARAAGVLVVGREILGGVGAPQRAAVSPDYVATAIRSAVRNPLITIPLLGTTNVAHLRSAAATARASAQDPQLP